MFASFRVPAYQANFKVINFSLKAYSQISYLEGALKKFQNLKFLHLFVAILQKSHFPKWIKGVLHLWALFLKTLCIFSKNKANSDKVSYGSGQKCSKEPKNHSFTSVETIVVKLHWKMCENQYFPCFEPIINNHLS